VVGKGGQVTVKHTKEGGKKREDPEIQGGDGVKTIRMQQVRLKSDNQCAETKKSSSKGVEGKGRRIRSRVPGESTPRRVRGLMSRTRGKPQKRLRDKHKLRMKRTGALAAERNNLYRNEENQEMEKADRFSTKQAAIVKTGSVKPTAEETLVLEDHSKRPRRFTRETMQEK